MTTPPTVSVVLSVYNGARYVGSTIESVLNQSYTDFEFLIADDGSTDDSWQIVSDYARRDSRIRASQNGRNIGASSTVNTLFVQAQGQYVTRHDADDISLSDKLASQVAFFNQQPEVGVLATAVGIIDEDGQPVPNFNFFTTETDSNVLANSLLRDCYLCQGSVMFRRKFLAETGLYDEQLVWAEDYDLWLRLAENTRLACLPQVHYLYRVHPAGISRHKFPQQMYVKGLALDRALLRRFGHVPSQYAEPLVRYYLRAAIGTQASAQPRVARFCFQRALQIAPSRASVELTLPKLMADYTSQSPLADALALVRTVMTGLPRTYSARQLTDKLLARLYLREVFAQNKAGDPGRTLAHLLNGLRHDPIWLFNRGVLSILVQALIGKLMGRFVSHGARPQ